MGLKLGRMAVELGVDSGNLSSGLDQATAELDQFEQSLTGLNTQALDAMLAGLENQFSGMEADLAKFDARIEATQSKMAMGGTLGSTINEDPGILKMQQSASNLQASLDAVRAKITKVKSAISTIQSNPINKLKTAFQEVGNKAQEAGDKSDQSMKKSMKTILKAGALLIGLRTAYSLITRSVQAYLGQNSAMQMQINSMYVALGSLLAPAIETVVKWMTGLVQWVIVAAAYTAKFLNVIFGLNIGIKKNVASTGALNKNLKGTSKALSNLAGFDDLTILQSATSTGGAATPDASAVDLSPYDMTSKLTGLDAFAEKLKALKPILAPILALLGGIALGILAFMSPIAGVVMAIGILIGVVALVISKWDSLNSTQQTLLKLLGLITIAIGAWIVVQWLLNAATTANPIGLIIVGIAALIAIIALLIVYWDDVVAAVKTFATNAWTWITTLVGNIGKAFSSIGTAISGAFSSAFNSVKTVAGNVWDWILKLFSKGGQIFSGVVDGVSNVFKGVVNALISGINILIAVPFKAINSLLNNIRSTNIMGFKPFIGMWSVNPLSVPQIPKLATGGIATRPVTAQVGEGRYNEAVIPLGASPQFADMKRDIADMVLQGMSAMGGGSADVVLVVDGDTWGRASIKNINKVQRQAGQTLLKL